MNTGYFPPSWLYGEVSQETNYQDLKRAIKLMKVNKATDESGMIAEYIKALGEQDLKNLRVLMNDVVKVYPMNGRRAE